MFVECNVNQATDHCAAMHVKGWLFCWLSKHNCPFEFAQWLAQSLQKTPIYETIRVSEDVSFNLLYTAGDCKTAVVLGCDPRSPDGMSTFKRVLQWAKLNELSVEIAPNRADYDEQTRHLLAELGLSTAHPAALKGVPLTKQHDWRSTEGFLCKTCGHFVAIGTLPPGEWLFSCPKCKGSVKYAKETEITGSSQRDEIKTIEQPRGNISSWKKLLGSVKVTENWKGWAIDLFGRGAKERTVNKQPGPELVREANELVN